MQTAISSMVTHTQPSRVRTLSDLGDGDHDEESDDDRHQNFFAGGEKSYVVHEKCQDDGFSYCDIRGMVVQGPNKQNDVVNQILKKAAE